MLTLSFIYKGLKNVDFFKNMDMTRAVGWASLFGVATMVVSVFVVARIARQVTITEEQKFAFVERIFTFLQIITAAYVAFAHGANDVANAIGPLAAVYHIATTGEVAMKVGVPVWILMLGGVGIVTGLLMMGWKVMETIGTKITEITPSRGFASQFAGATAVLVCSKMGLPVSTTHCLVGAVMGVALVRGVTALNAKVVWGIFGSWIATVPITAVVTVALYWGIRLVLGLG
jgi:PiT family inorganic phosphate transporter